MSFLKPENTWLEDHRPVQGHYRPTKTYINGLPTCLVVLLGQQPLPLQASPLLNTVQRSSQPPSHNGR